MTLRSGSVTLRTMTAEETADYHDRLAEGYARQQVELGGFSADDARARTASSMAELWPSGKPGPEQHVYAAEVDGEVIGRLWLAESARPPAVPGQAWIFDVEVDEPARGRGHGRGLMEATVSEARRLGCTSIGLNVFGGNDVAIRLYQSMGFRTRAMQLSLAL